jgi:hypothetical protein
MHVGPGFGLTKHSARANSPLRSMRGPAAVNGNRRTGNRGAGVTRQEGGKGSNLFDRSKALVRLFGE